MVRTINRSLHKLGLRIWSKSGVVIEPAEVDVTGREKDFASGVNPLPNHIKDVTAYAFREINGKPVVAAIQINIFSTSKGLEIRPLERLRRVVVRFGDVGLEIAGLVRRRCVKDAIVSTGLHLGRRPVNAGMVQTSIFRPAHTG